MQTFMQTLIEINENARNPRKDYIYPEPPSAFHWIRRACTDCKWDVDPDKLVNYMKELVFEDCLALFDVLCTGYMSVQHINWVVLMPIWGRRGVWKDLLNEHGFKLFDRLPETKVEYTFKPKHRAALAKIGIDVDENGWCEYSHTWDEFSIFAHGVTVVENGIPRIIKPKTYKKNPWQPKKKDNTMPKQLAK